LQGMPSDSWILSQSIEPAVAEMQQNKLSLDALVHVRHLSQLRVFAKRHPHIAIVIDHAAKPNIAAGEFNVWAAELAGLAALPQVYCKLSGLLTEASEEQGVGQLRPYVTHLYRLFGAERLMWGSDWPVITLAPNHAYASYSDWFKLAKQLLPNVSAVECEAIFGLNATNFYRF
jgi:L-fuconolactonase